jgi:predicted polyphosphate/ATP-dependent NAD kinase
LKIPYDAHYVQSSKSSSPASEQHDMEEIAAAVIKQMDADTLYILGPGTTTRAIASQLHLEQTLIGVDVILNQALFAKDVSEAKLLSLLKAHPRAKIIVTPIGGQGFIFGRGNQQISAKVISKVGVENIVVVSTVHKIIALEGRPLLIDTDDPKLDKKLEGYRQVTTGYRQKMVYRVSNQT